MFYRSDAPRPEALRHNPFKAIVAPRPIGWISTVNRQGLPNLAPYSFFNGIADAPMMVMFSNSAPRPHGTGLKDSVTNARETGEFCFNYVSRDLTEAMNVSSRHFPSDVNEFDRAGLEMAPCELVSCSRVAAAPASLECRVWKLVDLPGDANAMVIGEVVGLHVSEAFVHDGIFDVTLAQPVSRLGYRDYAVTRELFSLARPDD